jgi:hypothetical protein
MANIFSGLFNPGGNNNAMALARYNQELEDYGIKRDAYDQSQALKNIDPYIKRVLESMSPERQNHLLLQRRMMGEQPLFKKGIEGFNTSIKQRGTTIADILKQDKALEIANAKHKYKVDNPLPGDVGHKLEYAYAYAGGKEAFDKLPLEEKQKTMDRAARARQLVDEGTHWRDVVTDETYSKNVGKVETIKVVGKNIGERLSNYKRNRAAQQSMALGFRDSLGALERLHEGATGWTTGYGAFLRFLPESKAAEWFMELETVNSQTVLDTMKELKSMSQTGSTGFGAVNLKELETMMNKWGKLDPHAGDKAIKDVVTRRIEIMKELTGIVNKASKEEEAWYRRNRYNIPKSAQEILPDEQVDNLDDTQGFIILD